MKPRPKHDLALAVGRYGALAELMTDRDVGHVKNSNRHAFDSRDDDILDLLDGRGAADPLHQQHFAGLVFVDVAAADVEIVRAHRVDQCVKRDGVPQQTDRVDANLIFLFQAAPGIDFGHAADRSHFGLDDPIVHGAQFGEVARLARQRIVEHFAQTRGHRPHRGPFNAFGHFDAVQSLGNLLAGQVNIRAVAKSGDHGRCAELRYRADFLQSANAADRQFDRKRDQSFDLLGHQCRSRSIDLHLHGRGVGKSVEVERTTGKDAHDRHQDRDRDH